jgi:hypothetical protein
MAYQLLAAIDLAGNPLSFADAEGFGAIAVGDRAGTVIKVTNLNSNGPGSLQAACEIEGPSIIVFDISGEIRGDVAIKNSFITIAGQTAPCPGITIEGRFLLDQRTILVSTILLSGFFESALHLLPAMVGTVFSSPTQKKSYWTSYLYHGRMMN